MSGVAGKARAGLLLNEKTFKQAAEHAECGAAYERLLARPKYVRQGRARVRAKPKPRKKLSEIYEAPVDPEAQDFV